MDIQLKGDSYTCTFSRDYVFNIWCSFTGSPIERTKKVIENLKELLPENYENVDITDYEFRISTLCMKIAMLWKKSSRSKHNLISKYSDWLGTSEVVILPKHSTTSQTTDHHDRRIHTGRPLKDFAECSARSKRRRLAELAKVDESAVNILMETSNSCVNNSKSEINLNEILSLITEAKLTKHQYLLIKEFVNSRKNSVFIVCNAKKECYPQEIKVSESSAEVELQSLLDHTTRRILESQKELLSAIPCETMGDLFLVGKWGFDGSSGHSEYKQAFANTTVEDGSLFMTSYVPLRLISVNTTSEETIIWKNPRPSSTRYCRPIRFQFAKETKQLTDQEESYFKEKIQNLEPTKFLHDGNEIDVNHSLQLTMVDGKVCSALSQYKSTATCYICGCMPTGMNDIDRCLEKSVDHSTLEFGLSPLHSWIRFFEYFIHVSYKLDIKKWQARTEEEKESVSNRKKKIQNDFRRSLGLIVDKPRSGGSGNSNDGNTARKFFKNPEISSAITGIPQNLIERCGTILECLSSGYKISISKFEEFAVETARLLVKEFPWYRLPASIHKVLIHGATVIEHALVPIGELSEEAAESGNKNLKSFRRDFTRKISRTSTNLDLLNRLLMHSDPLITSIRKLPRKKKSLLTKATLDLLVM